jgi:hypothetical protein
MTDQKDEIKITYIPDEKHIDDNKKNTEAKISHRERDSKKWSKRGMKSEINI